MKTPIGKMLDNLGIHPVLVDVGASGVAPSIWNDIARHSVYVGFDPDRRELHETSGDRFWKSYIINKAITSEKDSDRVHFYLTSSPFCSSTLPPDSTSLSNYLFSDYFAVEKEVVVQATTLDAVLQSLGLPHVHWFKTDSQGTDLRLFTSLNEEARSRVLAVDMEPGLIDAYLGEDLFVDAHRYLTQHGFWLSDLAVRGSVRIGQSAVSFLQSAKQGSRPSQLHRALRESPGWCEVRYFRTLESLQRIDSPRDDYVLLWAFALVDKQVGFALDLALAYERAFGRDATSAAMKQRAISLVRSDPWLAAAKQLVPLPLRHWVRTHVLG